MRHGPAPLPFVRGGAVLVLAACADPTAGDTAPATPASPPSITSAEVTCDGEAGEWTVTVTTDGWTGNGQLLLSTDGEYVERHPLYSRSAAADGSADELGLTLAVVPDWRDVTLGASTYFNCLTTDLTGIVRVFTRDGTAVADCRAFGAAPERWAAWDAGASCDETLE